MAEMIIPGTYIDVRDEGLVYAGAIATGIVGVVGTASRGPVYTPVTLGGFSDANDVFGFLDDYKDPLDGVHPLTLVRALQFIYGQGASMVVAVRVAASVSTATVKLYSGTSPAVEVVTLTAKTPGTWANHLLVSVDDSPNDCRISAEPHEVAATTTSITLNYSPIANSPENQIRVRSGATKVVTNLTIIITGTPKPGEVLLDLENGALTFADGQKPAAGDTVIATYVVDKIACALVKLADGENVERYIVPSGAVLAGLIQESSQLVEATANASNGHELPKRGFSSFMTGGSNGADATVKDYSAGLDCLSNMLINIVHLAGQDVATMGDTLLAHVNSASENDRERIGVIGASGPTFQDYLAHTMSSGRIVVVAPGVRDPNGLVLPPAYNAAAITGLISVSTPETSLTNKTANIAGLSMDFNRGQQAQLIQRNVLAIVLGQGFRVVKGITTAGEGTPFSNISIRRIVDYAKYGVRSASNSYLGRLNNDRVRGALKSSLDAFLTGMVEDEMLTDYQLEVTATRAEEVSGIVNVIMSLLPTFSIDYIRVTMILR
ncbi:MAG TPA: phage tail sheath C-terminal domain-containing protein [Candidatus Angelobacter sp.]|nr:phage tail sheath C-terminal domain-containing protein [Candidatus Angelobacter sp.]